MSEATYNDTGLTTADAMRVLGVKHPATVYDLFKQGKIRGNKIRNQYRFSRLSCEQWLSGEKVHPIRKRPARSTLPPVPGHFRERIA